MPEPSSVPSGPEPSDEELVRRARGGDEAAARLLFDRHLPALRAKAAARLPAAMRGRVGASDVVQEAWLSAFLALGGLGDAGDATGVTGATGATGATVARAATFDSEGSFAAWLRKIVERKVADEVRRHGRAKKRSARREVRFATEAGRLEPDRDQPTPSQAAGDAEQSAALRAVLGELSPDHAEVIRLVHEEGLTLVEAGRRMGRTPDATRMLYGRAMHRLAERLPDEGA